MRDALFGSASREARASLRASARAGAAAFVQECRAIWAMLDAAAPEDVEFLHGEIACELHLAPTTAMGRLNTALALRPLIRLVAALEQGRLGVGHAQAVLDEVSHLDEAMAVRVVDAVLGEGDDPVELTGGQLRGAIKRAIHVIDAQAAKKRHEQAKNTAGVRGRPGVDGMGQIVIDCTAAQMVTGLAAIKNRAAVMPFDDPDLTQGQKDVAAFLHAIGCSRVGVQAVLECPVERSVDLNALAHAGVWGVDVRMPIAVALGLSDHPAVLTGYGPIGADEARALLPAADLVRACVDAITGEVLAVDRPVRAKSWQAGDGDRAAALRAALIEMATAGGTIPDLSTDGYVPGEALGRLVDLRDVTSTFPGDSTPARRSDRDHRLPWPLGRTDEANLQNATRRWHRAKHTNWRTHLLDDGTIAWISPGNGVYFRRPQRTRPPKIPDGSTLPPLDDLDNDDG